MPIRPARGSRVAVQERISASGALFESVTAVNGGYEIGSLPAVPTRCRPCVSIFLQPFVKKNVAVGPGETVQWMEAELPPVERQSRRGWESYLSSRGGGAKDPLPAHARANPT